MSIQRRTIAAILLTLAAACSAVPSEPGDVPPQLDQLPRALTSGEHAIIGATNDFSFGLFRTVSASQRDSSVFISPLSASYALGLTANGAAGTTLAQMHDALGLGGMTEGDANAVYHGLTSLLRGLDPAVDLRIANGVWVNRGFPVSPAFVQAASSSFDARTATLDFRDPAALAAINGWISDATAGRIPRMMASLDDGLVMLIANAIYFKGSWRERFDVAETRAGTFHGVAGNQPAMLMHRTGSMPYAGTSDWDAVDLPYGNGAFTMTVVLPRDGRSVETVAASLQSSSWAALTAQLRPTTVDLVLPRFRMEWTRVLNPDLQSLGMRDAFADGVADFSRLTATGARGPFISKVLQKTFVEVNEEGTEAAAATTVGISVTSLPATIPVHADHPFLLVIRERLSGTVLFMGKVVGLT